MSPRRAARLTVLLALAFAVFLPACRRDDPKALGLELLPVDGSPFVAVRVQIEVGSAFDPPGKEGLCRLAWAMLQTGGSRTRSAGDIASALAPTGASIRLRVDQEASAFSALVKAADLEALYSILREALLEPGFREDDFERVKAAQLGSLRESTAGGEDGALAESVLRLMIDGGGPRSHPAAGWEESLGSITLDEVRAFYAEHFVRGNVTIGLAGGFPAGFPERVEADFARLSPTFTPRLVPAPPPAHDGIEAVLVERPGAAATIALDIPIPLTRADDDLFALWVAAAHLGEPGLLLGRISADLRDERALAGGGMASAAFACSDAEAFPAPCLPRRTERFLIRIRSVDPGNAPFVVNWTMNELRILAEDGLAEERFALIRDNLLGSLGRRSRSLEDRLALRMEAQALGAEALLDRAGRILPRLSAGDVRSAVRKHLAPGGLFLAIVTDGAAAVREGLLSASPPLPLRPEAVRVVAAADFIRSGGRPDR